MNKPKFTPGYEVTPDGRVFSVASNWRGYGCREMKQDLNSHGYPRVRLTINGIRKVFLVHKLVAAKYLPDRPSNQHEIRHLDDNKQNNNYLNLAWGTRSDNAADRSRNGHTSKGIFIPWRFGQDNINLKINGSNMQDNKQRWTPGPWKVEKPDGAEGWCDVAGFLEAACTCYGKKAEANAALIAAAPEMYEALADIAENCGNHGCSETCAEADCKICEILKKARGEA